MSKNLFVVMLKFFAICLIFGGWLAIINAVMSISDGAAKSDGIAYLDVVDGSDIVSSLQRSLTLRILQSEDVVVAKLVDDERQDALSGLEQHTTDLVFQGCVFLIEKPETLRSTELFMTHVNVMCESGFYEIKAQLNSETGEPGLMSTDIGTVFKLTFESQLPAA